MGSDRRSRSRKRHASKRRRRRHDYSTSPVSSVSSILSSTDSEPRRSRKNKKHKHSKNKKRRDNDSHKNKVSSDKSKAPHNRNETSTPPLVNVNPASSTHTNSTHPQSNSNQNNNIPISNSSPSIPTPVHAFNPHVNIVPEFDPSDGSQNIESWIHKVNECAQIYSWNDTQICYYALAKLSGLAKRWYQGLPSLMFNWQQWTEKLKLAFPSTENYGDLLQKMLQLRCKLGQPLDVYYYEKMILINKCEISGQKAVGCLVHGIDDKFIRMSANSCRFNEPEQLFSYLKTLAQSDNYLVHKRKVTWNRESKPTPTSGNSGVDSVKSDITCFNCGEVGHIRSKCTKPMKRCQSCKRVGHTITECRVKSWGGPTGNGNGSNTNLLSITAPPTDKSVMRIMTTIQNVEAPKIQSSEFDNEKYYKDIKINKFSKRAFIDLGSTCTLIKESVANEIFPSWTINKSLPNLRGFGNSTVKPLGVVNGLIQIDDVESPVDLIVVSDHFMPCDLIIGQTFTELSDVVIVKTPLHLAFYKAPGLACTELNTKFKLNIISDVNIQPSSTSPVDTSTSTEFNGPLYVPAGYCETGNKHYFVLPGIYNFDNSKGYVMVSNVTSTVLSLKGDHTVARGYIYDEVNEPDVRITTTTNQPEIPLPLGDIKIGTKLTNTELQNFHDLLLEHRDCFALNLSELGKTDLTEMVIKLKDDIPVVYNPYRMSIKEKDQLSIIIEDLLKNGIIRESSSSYASPVLLVNKKNGQKRLCIDYRALNRKTLKDKYPLPRIEDKLDCLGGNNFFSSLDLASGYYQVPVAEKCKHLTAFVTPDGLYEFNRMPFGLANAPSVFQRAMNMMLNKAGQKLVLAYMDDLLVPSVSIEEGLTKLKKVMTMLRDSKLTLNLDKCVFFQEQIEYLGYEISREGIRPGSLKIDCVKHFPTPKNVHEIRQFVGLASYFRKFVRNFSLIARPLTILTKKNEPWRFESEQISAFNELKEILINRPVLTLYNPQASIEVHTDASKLGIGAILLQDDGKGLQPIAYYSRQTSPEEQKFHSYELETLAVITALNRFRVYLLGIHFKLVTDCNAIRSTMTKKDLVPRVARWWIAMQEFDFDIEYRAGVKMAHVDALSRNPIDVPDPPSRDEDVNIFRIEVLGVASISTDDNWLQTVQQADSELQRIVNILKDPENDNVVEIKNNFIYKNDKLYRKVKKDDTVQLLWVVPKSVRWQILKSNHDDVGHFGYDKTYERVKKVYWFKNMRKFVKKYCKSCLHCAHNKVPGGPKEGYLHPIPKPDKPFDTLHADHCGPFPLSKRRNAYILAIIDSFTKYIYIKPVKNCKTKTTIIVFEEYFSLFGVPRRLITDRGTSFTSHLFTSFVHDKGMIHILNAVSSPRANGQIERYNRSIVESITAMNHDQPDNEWDSKVPQVQWGLNNTVNKATGKSPAELLFGVATTSTSDGPLNPVVSQLNYCANRDEIRADSSDRMRAEQQKQKERFDKNRKREHNYKEGDLVRVERDVGGLPGQSKKLLPKFCGPYRIVKVLGNDRYEIEDTPITKKAGKPTYKAVFAVDKMHPWLAFSNDPIDSESE